MKLKKYSSLIDALGTVGQVINQNALLIL